MTLERNVAEKIAGSSEFRRDLAALLNKHSKENGSNTPDWILADHLANCLESFDQAVGARERWYGIRSVAGEGTRRIEE